VSFLAFVDVGWTECDHPVLLLFEDDLTICAVSEWTGRIALGSRAGAISLL